MESKAERGKVFKKEKKLLVSQVLLVFISREESNDRIISCLIPWCLIYFKRALKQGKDKRRACRVMCFLISSCFSGLGFLHLENVACFFLTVVFTHVWGVYQYFMSIIGLGFCILPNTKRTFSFLLWFMFIALTTLFYVRRVLIECMV